MTDEPNPRDYAEPDPDEHEPGLRETQSGKVVNELPKSWKRSEDPEDNIVSTDLTVHEERKTSGHYSVTLKFYIVFDNGQSPDDPAYYTYSKAYYSEFSFGNEGEIAKAFVDHIGYLQDQNEAGEITE